MNSKRKYGIYVMIFCSLCGLGTSLLVLLSKEIIYFYNLILPIISILGIIAGVVWLIRRRASK